MKLSKTSKTIVIILIVCEILFLIRTFVLYSFYTNDEMYGDGKTEPDQYNIELLKWVIYSLGITFILICFSILIFRKLLKNKL